MATQKIQLQNTILRPYGVTEKKKAELDALTTMVLDAQYDVEQYQAIVESLTEKSTNFQVFLATADTNKQLALSNMNMVDSIINGARDLRGNSEIAHNEALLANFKTARLAPEIKDLMDKLIYSAEIINKLSNLVIRKKAMNPLISDELISLIGTAGTDANNAVALTLIALKSAFAVQATNMEADAAALLEYNQSMKLYEILTGTAANGAVNTKQQASILGLIQDAYKTAKADYEHANEANTLTTKQLNGANSELNKAQIKLKSLQAGLAAANAAALAS